MPLDIFDANERLQRLIDGIGTLASGVGTAKQVLDFVSEQKNVLLATHSRPFLDGTHPSCNGRK